MIIRLLEPETFIHPFHQFLLPVVPRIAPGDIFRPSERRYFALFRLSDLPRTSNSSSGWRILLELNTSIVV